MLLRTRDDRSRRVPLHLRGLIATGESRGSRALRRGLVRLLRTLLSRPAILLIVALSVVAAAVLGAANFGPVVIALILFSPVAATWITLLAMSLVSAGEWFGAESNLIKAAMLRECSCPSCDYDLSGVEPAPDGCTVCPECSAAWRMDAPKYQPRQRVVVMAALPAPPADSHVIDTPEASDSGGSESSPSPSPSTLSRSPSPPPPLARGPFIPKR